MIEVTDFQKIGIVMTGCGTLFLTLGIFLFFDRGLLAVGNILFLAGLAFIIGYQRTFWFFFQKHKWQGSCFFFFGIFIVLFGWPVVGIVIEFVGFYKLFGWVLMVIVVSELVYVILMTNILHFLFH